MVCQRVIKLVCLDKKVSEEGDNMKKKIIIFVIIILIIIAIVFGIKKINESKILHDEDAFKYWNANLNNLKNKKEYTNIYEQHFPSYNNPPEN